MKKSQLQSVIWLLLEIVFLVLFVTLSNSQNHYIIGINIFGIIMGLQLAIILVGNYENNDH